MVQSGPKRPTRSAYHEETWNIPRFEEKSKLQSRHEVDWWKNGGSQNETVGNRMKTTEGTVGNHWSVRKETVEWTRPIAGRNREIDHEKVLKDYEKGQRENIKEFEI